MSRSINQSRRRAAVAIGLNAALGGLAGLGGVMGLQGTAHAQAAAARPSTPGWPTRPITMVVPFAAGNVTDAIARLVADRLAVALGQPVVVENKPGAGAGIGMSAIQRAPADGYTIGMGAIGPLALNPALYTKLAYDPVEGITPISVVYKGPTLILVDAASPIRSLSELVKQSQAAADGIDYATAGNGSSMHLTGELFARATGAKLRHVPNRGSGAAATLLLGKHVPVLFDSTTASMTLVRSGQVRALAVTSAQRLPALPDVPTLAEAGYPGIVVDGWLLLLGPAGLPTAIRDRLADEARVVMGNAEVQAKVAASGGVATAMSADESAAFVKAEQKRWGDLVRAIGLKLD